MGHSIARCAAIPNVPNIPGWRHRCGCAGRRRSASGNRPHPLTAAFPIRWFNIYRHSVRWFDIYRHSVRWFDIHRHSVRWFDIYRHSVRRFDIYRHSVRWFNIHRHSIRWFDIHRHSVRWFDIYRHSVRRFDIHRHSVRWFDIYRHSGASRNLAALLDSGLRRSDGLSAQPPKNETLPPWHEPTAAPRIADMIRYAQEAVATRGNAGFAAAPPTGNCNRPSLAWRQWPAPPPAIAPRQPGANTRGAPRRPVRRTRPHPVNDCYKRIPTSGS